MAVNSTHPQYDKYLEKWNKCRTVINGSDSVKKAGELYLPRLSCQSDVEYDSYKKRGLFFEGTNRTLQGLSGMLFRKEPIVSYPDDLDYIGGGIEDLFTFITKVADELLITGRCGILVDLPVEGDAEPYFFKYNTESIINWKITKVNNKEILSMVVLKEIFLVDGKDEFAQIEEERYRVLKMQGGIYFQEVYIKGRNNGKEEWYLSESFTPTHRGLYFDFIPFMFITPQGNNYEISNPPLLALSEVNLSHYRTSCDLEHGRHYLGLPTPWVSGFATDAELLIGASTAWVSSDPDAKCGMLEFTGKGLGCLENALKEKQIQMVILGARILEESKSYAESSDSQQNRKAGEQSVLGALSKSLSHAFTKLLQWKREWEFGNLPTDISVVVNKDFDIAEINADKLTSLTENWLKGAYSYETLFYNLKKNEMLPEDIDLETEKQLILQGNEMRGLGTLVDIEEE